MVSELLTELASYKERYVDSHPIFTRLSAGDFTRFHYLAYLRETFHLVKHTPQYLSIAEARVATTDERLSKYFGRFSAEESGHELLCIKDIVALGEDVDRVISGEMNPGVWAMVTQCYYWASHANPVALLGDALATEELGIARSADAARALETTLDIPRQATNFLQVHGSEDAAHLKAAAQAIQWYATRNDLISEIRYAAKMTYRNYGQLFTDVMELGDLWSKRAM